MSDAKARVVYDCNIYAQALININGPAGSCVRRALKREVILFLSEKILAEIRELPSKPSPARLGVTKERTEVLIQSLLKASTLAGHVPERFIYQRDPDDAHYVDLALAANARLIVSRDKDLLSLMDSTRKEAQDFQLRFPGLKILDPVQFLRDLDALPQ